MNEDSEYWETFSKEDKKQLLYIIFRILVLGGSMTQPDETTEDYINFTKLIYKNLVW